MSDQCIEVYTIPDLNTFPDQSIDIYTFSDLYMFPDQFSFGLVYSPPHKAKKMKLYELVKERLYELVGETYISMNRLGNVYISMQVGVAVIGEWTFGKKHMVPVTDTFVVSYIVISNK